MNASALPLAANPTPSLREILYDRRTQAQAREDAYAPGSMSAEGTMTFWLATAAKELREAAGRKQVHIAATMNKDQSTVYRFEQGETIPRELNLFVAAYADDLDITAIQIWERALELWREAEAEASVAELLKGREAQVRALPQPGPALRRQGKAPSPSAASRRRHKTA